MGNLCAKPKEKEPEGSNMNLENGNGNAEPEVKPRVAVDTKDTVNLVFNKRKIRILN